MEKCSSSSFLHSSLSKYKYTGRIQEKGKISDHPESFDRPSPHVALSRQVYVSFSSSPLFVKSLTQSRKIHAADEREERARAR